MKPYKPKPLDFEQLMMQYYAVYGIEKLSGILAWYQLQDKEFLDKQDFKLKYEHHKHNVYNLIQNIVLGEELSVIISKEERMSCNDPDGLDIFEWTEEVPCIKLSEFAEWVKRNENFKCPQVILDKARINDKLQLKEVNGKVGKPKGYLAEVVEHVFGVLIGENKQGLLKQNKVREFIIKMKEMATKGNPLADEYVLERIKSIQVPEEGACIIITEDNVKLSGQNETIVRGKQYTNNDVAKILTGLRKNNNKST